MVTETLILLALGLVAGVVGGLLGVGGSVVMIPALTLVFGTAQHLYQGAAMMVNFFVALPAALQHRRAGAVLPRIVGIMMPCALLGVVVGVWLSAGPWFRGDREVHLARGFGVFLLYVVAYNIYRLISNRQFPDMTAEDARGLPAWKIALAVGLPTGLLGGLLGIGGGAVAVPLQQVLLRVPLRRAIANSAVTIIPLSLLGATYKNYNNALAGIAFADALRLALLLIPTAIIGGYLGGRLTHVAPRRGLRIAFTLLMCYAAVTLIRRPARPPLPVTRPVPASTTSPSTALPAPGRATLAPPHAVAHTDDLIAARTDHPNTRG